MDPSALSKLLSPEGWALLGQLPPYDETTALRLASGLRERGVDAELVAAAMTQSRLRAKGRAKFREFADGMLFTQAGLEQATRLTVAARHAARYSGAGATLVADLGCGIGGDAMAMGALGLSVLAVEQDELTAAVATVNTRHFPDVTVRHADAMAVDLRAEGVDAVFADPARRTTGGRRVFDPRAYTPPLDQLLALREQVPALGLKVAPGIPHTMLPPESHAQWVSVDGDVVEAGLWFGALAPEGPGRSALVLRDGGAHTLADDAVATADAPVRTGEVRPLDHYLYEPDGAVIRAGLVARAGELVGAGLVADSIAYLTGPRLEDSPFLTAYRVLDSLPFSLKPLRTYLRDRQVGTLTIKKRGTAVEPAQLRRQLSLSGPASATIVLTRVAGRQTVIVVEPV
ncbi:class I SAM-dependent methyltransferase [Georgenia sp. 311]|uniref:class I SAM-dependent methyltransferase n=1 Tax=Georgenia sp. 311 TaxID=2585134 RepID=UPI00111283A3|nr:class I SAM-dependent methyltransferase [Georgenia sp. 311]TNC19251.1 class I SAM-dependent methyltransferase [Georgenia sp. 311]